MGFLAEFDSLIRDCIQHVLEQEKEVYNSKFETFGVYSARLKKQMIDRLDDFKAHFENGYAQIIEQLRSTHDDIEPYLIHYEALKKIATVDAFVAFLEDGRPLYTILGIQPGVLERYYKSAYTITESGRLEAGYDAYYFLVTIAPQIRDAWLNFGYVASRLGDYLGAIEAYGAAYTLDPTKSDSYLYAAEAYKLLDNPELVNDAYTLGIDYANEHADAPWATSLRETLLRAQNEGTLI